jgi:hypothetical protein
MKREPEKNLVENRKERKRPGLEKGTNIPEREKARRDGERQEPSGPTTGRLLSL